jgi:hypothetical protein
MNTNELALAFIMLVLLILLRLFTGPDGTVTP